MKVCLLVRALRVHSCLWLGINSSLVSSLHVVCQLWYHLFFYCSMKIASNQISERNNHPNHFEKQLCEGIRFIYFSFLRFLNCFNTLLGIGL